MSLKEPLAALIDSMIDLIRLMEEESEELAISGPCAATDALAQAKIRLADRMEAQFALLQRLSPDWMTVLEGEDRLAFTETGEELRRAAIVNSAVLGAEIGLSTEMLAAVGRELERVSGVATPSIRGAGR